jgi:hypothetical protein
MDTEGITFTTFMYLPQAFMLHGQTRWRHAKIGGKKAPVTFYLNLDAEINIPDIARKSNFFSSSG